MRLSVIFFLSCIQYWLLLSAAAEIELNKEPEDDIGDSNSTDTNNITDSTLNTTTGTETDTAIGGTNVTRNKFNYLSWRDFQKYLKELQEENKRNDGFQLEVKNYDWSKVDIPNYEPQKRSVIRIPIWPIILVLIGIISLIYNKCRRVTVTTEPNVIQQNENFSQGILTQPEAGPHNTAVVIASGSAEGSLAAPAKNAPEEPEDCLPPSYETVVNVKGDSTGEPSYDMLHIIPITNSNDTSA